MATILLVDDERDLVFYTGLWLKEEGFDVLQAYNGVEALDVLAAETVDLVVLDVMMPRMSGWDALAAIRANPNTVGMPVVLYTARAEDGDKARGWQLGADWYICKPCDLDDLLAAIKRLLSASEESVDAPRAGGR